MIACLPGGPGDSIGPTNERHKAGQPPAKAADKGETPWTDAISSAAAPLRPPLSPSARALPQTPIRRTPITLINPFPPGGAADMVGRPLTAVLEPILKQPVRHRDQGRRRRPVGAQYAATAKPDGYTLLIHITSISGFAEVDKLFGRTAEIHPRRFHSDRALRPPIPCVLRGQRQAALQDAEGIRRRRQEAARTSSIFSVVRPLWRAAPADRAVHESRRHQDAPSADQWRRAGAHRAPRQQFAGAGVVDLRRRSRRSRPASCARSPCSAPNARRRCPTCRRMKELGYDVEYYLWVGLFAPKGTPAPVDRQACARPSTRRADTDTVQDGDRTISARNSPIMDQPDFAEVLGRGRRAYRSRGASRSASKADRQSPLPAAWRG